MPRKLRVEYPGAIYHIMSRGNRREAIFHDEVDRQDFLKTLAEACTKADFQIHAYCLMSNHFHLVLETPNGNLVAGMRWLLSSYTLRLNHRRKLTGHVFSGRYKALLVDGNEDGYLKTVCDYVHLNPVRANLLGSEDRLLAYPWSSLSWYLTAPEHRPAWMRTERLMGSHGILEDSASGRKEFEERMERRRASETEDEAWEPLRRGWCIGTEAFKKEMLERMDKTLGDHHSGKLRQESAEAKAERMIGEELRRVGWSEEDLLNRRKSDPVKLALANRLRRETILTVKTIAERLHMGSPKSARARLRESTESEVQRKARQSSPGNENDPFQDVVLL